MADVRVAPQTVTKAGAAPTYGGSLSATDTYMVANDGKTWLHIKKSGVGACTVTVTTPRTTDGLAVAELTFSVAATTGDMVAGPFPPETFNDSVGDLRVTYSDIAGLTHSAFRLA